MYIALEGIDTSGKSTQIETLKKHFKEAIFTLEPGGSELGKRLRKILLEDNIALDSRAEMLLFLADRAELISKVIKPNIDKLIISDRSLISGMAYAKDFNWEILKTFNLFATQNILPNKVVLLELDERHLKERLFAKGSDKIESRGLQYLLELQERLKYIIQNLAISCLIIDSSLSKEQITRQIIDFIQS
ncbi:MAG: dTMP kinase [Helicobacter sp.]|nr:dTMP kinase [Helicobacter sp.]